MLATNSMRGRVPSTPFDRVTYAIHEKSATSGPLTRAAIQSAAKSAPSVGMIIYDPALLTFRCGAIDMPIFYDIVNDFLID
jgi:hypothetical protein